MHITSLAELRGLYAAPAERAVKKQLSALDAHCRRFIGLSPFVVMATGGGELNGHTLLIPSKRCGGATSPTFDSPHRHHPAILTPFDTQPTTTP